MGVEMDDRDGLAVDLVEGPQRAERDAVVAAEGEEFGFAVGVGGGAGVQFEVGGGELLEGEGVVEGGEGDVAAVEDGGPGCVGVEAAAGVEAAEGGLARGGGADGAGAESGACLGG